MKSDSFGYPTEHKGSFKMQDHTLSLATRDYLHQNPIICGGTMKLIK